MADITYGWCKYMEVIVDSVVRCNTPCAGDLCLMHMQKMKAIDELDEEIARCVRGRKKSNG